MSIGTGYYREAWRLFLCTRVPRSTLSSRRLTAAQAPAAGTVCVWVLPVQSDTHPGPSLLRPFRPALLGRGRKGSDIISMEPDSSRLFSTRCAAQRGTHFIPIKQTQASQLHIMILFFFFFARGQACLPLAKRQEGTEVALKSVESLHLW